MKTNDMKTLKKSQAGADSNEGNVSFKEFADTFMAVGRGDQPPPDWAGKEVYVSDKAREFWSSGCSAKLLSDLATLIGDNWVLLSAIDNKQWESVAEFAQAIGRAESNVSRSLSKLERFGLVTLVPTSGRKKKPEITSRKLSFEMDVVTGEVKLLNSGRKTSKESKETKEFLSRCAGHWTDKHSTAKAQRRPPENSGDKPGRNDISTRRLRTA